MGIDPISSIVDLAGSIVGKIWPDKTQEEQGKMAQALALLNGQLANDQAQIGTNTAQALNAKLDSDEKHQAEIARLRKALTAIRTIKDRIPFDAADAATECIRIARIALEEK